MTERITSRRNPLLEQVRRLDTAALRRKAGVFLCDSPKLVGEAVQHGVSVQCVIAADGVAFPEGLPENVRRVTVPADVMASISPMPTPQGMLALCALPDMAAPARLSPGRYVVLDGVQDPGNVGAVLRTADAFGCTGALLLPGCADPYGPKTLRAAMGAACWQTRGCRCTARPCATTRWTCGSGICAAARWSLAAKAGASARRCWRCAARRCVSPCRPTASR